MRYKISRSISQTAPAAEMTCATTENPEKPSAAEIIGILWLFARYAQAFVTSHAAVNTDNAPPLNSAPNTDITAENSTVYAHMPSIERAPLCTAPVIAALMSKPADFCDFCADFAVRSVIFARLFDCFGLICHIFAVNPLIKSSKNADKI